MAHFAGPVPTGLHPSPVPYADVVSTRVHNSLGGPRSGLILCKAELARMIDSAVFPGQQGVPLKIGIAANADYLKAAASEAFDDRSRGNIEGAQLHDHI